MTTMGETSFQNPPPTGITPGITPDQLKEATKGHARHDAESDDARPSEEFVVRVRKNEATVAFILNTKRMIERREIERANETKRRSGG